MALDHQRVDLPSGAIHTGPLAAIGASEQQTDDTVLFLVVDPADLVGSTVPARTVVLTLSLDEAEVERHPGHSVFYATRVHFRVWEPDRLGILVWDARWVGGSVIVYRHDGQWFAVPFSSWIT